MMNLDIVDMHYAESDLSLLQKLTLVIPTYNRNCYLSRCLQYHSHFPFGEIIVADSSPEEKKVMNRETVRKVQEQFGANVRYLEYEPETEKYGEDISQKWGDAVCHVETEYTQICTDKEFVVPPTISACIQYLQQHPDYVVADALHYQLECDSLGTYYYRASPTADIHLENSWDRFIEMTENPVCTLNAVHRTCAIQQAYHSLFENAVSDLRFGEIYLELMDILLGKAMSMTNSIIIYRDTITFERTHGLEKQKESSSFRYPQIWDYSPSAYTKYYNNFKKGILATLLNSSAGEIERNSVDDIDRMLCRFISRRMGTSHPLRKINIAKNMFYRLPKKIKTLILTTVMSSSCGIADYSPKTLEINPDTRIILDIITHYSRNNQI